MSVDNRKCLVRVGKHASTSDWLTEPASYVQAGGGAHLRPTRHSFSISDAMKLARPVDDPLNVGVPPFRGPVNIGGSYELDISLKGLNGNNGGAIDPATTTDATPFLDCLFGTDSDDPAGAAATAVNAGSDGSTKTLAVSETARFTIGRVIRFEAPAGTYHVRQVRARSASSGPGTVTVDRIWTGAVADATTIIRFARWKDDPAVVEHTHLGFDVEWTGAARAKFLGAMGMWTIDLQSGRDAMLKVSGLRCTKIELAAPASTAFSAPTTGGAVVRSNNQLWIGDEAFYAHGITIVEGGVMSPRPADDGPSNVLGYTKHKGGDSGRTKLNAKFFRGALSGEIADDSGTFSARIAQGHSLNLGDVMGTWDLAVQAGSAAGALFYGVMREAVITRIEEGVFENKRGLDIDFEATGYDADLAPFEAHLG